MSNISRILNIEDSIGKHWEINRALEWNGYPAAELATSAEEGFSLLEKATNENKPFGLIVLDMHFTAKGKDDTSAGLYVIEELKRREIHIPVIVCSSRRYRIPEIAGCVFFNQTRDLNWDFREILMSLN